MAAVRMNENAHHHIPVLLNEAVSGLVVARDGIYIDATFGRGSHSRAILQSLSDKGRLIAFDKDPVSIAYAKQHIQDPRFTIVHRSFAQMQHVLDGMQLVGKVNGVLFDLGVSSPQLDDADRGFSFMRDGKLDMRMDTSQGMNAAEWLAKVDEQELARILWQYGEEKFSRRIARCVVETREENPIVTTLQLASLIRGAVPKTKSDAIKHPATRSFQAIRIFINQELLELEQGLDQAFNVLTKTGRLAAISFHSLEDRIVKQFIRTHEKGDELPRGLPVKGSLFNATLKTIGKPMKPSLKETNSNPRARSAILRIAEKLL